MRLKYNRIYSIPPLNADGYEDYTKPKIPALTTAGCGCCEADEPATAANVDAAIKQTKEFLSELKKLRKTL